MDYYYTMESKVYIRTARAILAADVVLLWTVFSTTTPGRWSVRDHDEHREGQILEISKRVVGIEQ